MTATDTNIVLSVNVLNGKVYEVPGATEDKKNIDAFLQQHAGKKVVVVQGLGFVGAVMALVVANALTEEYAVIGVDVPSAASYWKIQAINEGVFPVTASDPKIETFFNAACRKQNLYATCDPYAYSKADVIIVDINLDVQKQSVAGVLQGFDVDITPFKKAITTIGANCRPDVLVLVETTVPPGTCMKLVKPVLEEQLQLRGLDTAVKVAHSYERVMPGPQYIDSIQNFYRVYSGVDVTSADAAEVFLRTIIKTDEYPLTRLNNTQATEMAKVLENSYRAMNIAFMVEWSRFAEKAGVNIYDVVHAIRMRPTHKNIMLPGLGVGGYCLTKDPLLASWAYQNMFEADDQLTQSEKGVYINDQMPYYAFNFLAEQYKGNLQQATILLLGVSYLNDVGDTRYTPVEGFYNSLQQTGAGIALHDPFVTYWEEKKLTVENNLEQALENNYDVVIITTGHKLYRNNQWLLNKLMEKPALFIYDTIGVLSNTEINLLQQKHQVKVIGRGDL